MNDDWGLLRLNWWGRCAAHDFGRRGIVLPFGGREIFATTPSVVAWGRGWCRRVVWTNDSCKSFFFIAIFKIISGFVRRLIFYF